jgi:hypothetical protein
MCFPRNGFLRLLKLEDCLISSHLRVKSSFTHSYCIADDCLRVVKHLHDWLSMTGQQRNSWCNVLCEGRRTNLVLCLELLIVPWETQKCCRSTHRLLLLCFSSDTTLPPPTVDIIGGNTFVLEFKYPSLQKHYHASADADPNRRSVTMLQSFVVWELGIVNVACLIIL